MLPEHSKGSISASPESREEGAPSSIQLLDEVSRNEEVTRYQMKLAKKKIYDSCERKFIERERLRRELGA